MWFNVFWNADYELYVGFSDCKFDLRIKRLKMLKWKSKTWQIFMNLGIWQLFGLLITIPMSDFE